MARYRIVRDSYCGYEVQVWRWWFPFWLQCGFVNTHATIEAAEAYARRKVSGRAVVKYLGTFKA